jgi:flagellar biogenesis protein FliO
MSLHRTEILWLLMLTVLPAGSLRAQDAPPLAQANSVHPGLHVDMTSVEVADPVSADRLAELARRLAATPAQDSSTLPAAVDAAPAASASDPIQRLAPFPVSPNENLPLGSSARSGGQAGDPATGPGPSSPWILSTLGALAIVIILVFMMRALLCRLTGRPLAAGHSPVVEVLSRTSVAPRSHVLLVRLGQRILVLGDGAGGLRTLAQLEDPDEVAEMLRAVTSSRANSVTQGFAHLMSRFSGDYDRHRQSVEGGDHAEIHVDQARDQVSGLLSRVRAMARGT